MSFMTNEEGVRLTQIEKDYSDGRTKQAFKDETDVNQIIAKHARMNTLSHLEQWGGQYGDLAGFDFHEAQNQIAHANSMFEQLPSSVRNEFSNSPERFFEFVNDPENSGKLADLLPELAQPRKTRMPENKDVVDPDPTPTAPETAPEDAGATN